MAVLLDVDKAPVTTSADWSSRERQKDTNMLTVWHQRWTDQRQHQADIPLLSGDADSMEACKYSELKLEPE